MSDLNMSIGSVIKNKRVALNIKQEDIAEQLSVTVQTVSKWERDLTEPKASQVAKLSKILHLSEKSICDGEESKVSETPMDFMMKFGNCTHANGNSSPQRARQSVTRVASWCSYSAAFVSAEFASP